MTISREIRDDHLKGVDCPEGFFGDTGLMKALEIRLTKRMRGVEPTAHPGDGEGKRAPPGQANRRNGRRSKVLKGRNGGLPVAVPRDRDNSFEPEPVSKGQTRIDGVDDRIVGLYAAGLTVRDIQACPLDFYGLKVSPGPISRLTETVPRDREWPSRAPGRMDPIVMFDALRDIPIAAVDGPKNFPERSPPPFPSLSSRPASCIRSLPELPLMQGPQGRGRRRDRRFRRKRAGTYASIAPA
ncbi:transposase [Palleronia rufa]|uniref:transposase n=1 Tax=Palleronia rufa TaxID=1530186 RepID=UPI00068DB82B|nr:transposase [Palleronia rufa]